VVIGLVFRTGVGTKVGLRMMIMMINASGMRG
jgi:hypothetical protein